MKYTKECLEANCYYFFLSSEFKHIFLTNENKSIYIQLDLNSKRLLSYTVDHNTHPRKDVDWYWRKANNIEIAHVLACIKAGKYIDKSLFYEIY